MNYKSTKQVEEQQEIIIKNLLPFFTNAQILRFCEIGSTRFYKILSRNPRTEPIKHTANKKKFQCYFEKYKELEKIKREIMKMSVRKRKRLKNSKNDGIKFEPSDENLNHLKALHKDNFLCKAWGTISNV